MLKFRSRVQNISKSVPLHYGFTKTLKGFVDTPKRQTPKLLFNRSERCLTCRHFQKTSRRQADDQFRPVSEGQSSYLDSTDQVKHTVGQVWPLKRPTQAYEAKFVQHLASHEPNRL